ncbi:MAG: hypothetical protein LBB47_03590 [Spirochaetaceae bacterium]|jgi:hypothetical protein|nr:hypothetical protein [Spirochaetaceae bacterium]
MESGKKASIFIDRSAIGSAEELDEYGVWVKSEPEDIAFDDNAFPGETGKAAEITGIEDDFDFNLYRTGTDGAALTSGALDASDDSGFDVDFGADAAAEEFSAGPAADDIVVDDSDFNVDFGEDTAAGEFSTGPAADDAVVDDSGFGIDFGKEASGNGISTEFAPGPSIFEANAEDSGTSAGEYDFEITLDDIPETPQTTNSEPEAPEETDRGATGWLPAGPAADDAVVEEAGFGVDLGEVASGNGISTESVVGTHPFGICTEDSNTSAGEYDFEITLDDIPETPQTTSGETETPKTDKDAATRDGALSNELLLKIVDELSTIKAELNSLKDEISTIRGESSASKPVTYGPDAMPENLVTETLSATELDAVLSNAKIESIESIETGMAEEPPAALELDVPDDITDFGAEEVPSATELDAPDDMTDFGAEEVTPVAELDTPDDITDFEVEETEPFSDEISVDLELNDTFDEIPLVDAVEDTYGFSADSDSSGEAPVEDIVVPAPADAGAAQSAYDPLDTIYFKKDLQIVLSYMDKLLEALPDEKIEEFARSEQFDTYKKVFKELGLV